jgi:MoxR-like ATPase
MHHQSEHSIVARADDIREKVARARDAIGRVIFGQETVIELVLVNILSGGHALLIGVPGLAKT